MWDISHSNICRSPLASAVQRQHTAHAREGKMASEKVRMLLQEEQGILGGETGTGGKVLRSQDSRMSSKDTRACTTLSSLADSKARIMRPEPRWE